MRVAVYLDGVIVPWPIDYSAVHGFVVVWAESIDSHPFNNTILAREVTLRGNVTIVKMEDNACIE